MRKYIKAEISMIKTQPSRFGGFCTIITFRSDTGKSYITWLDESMNNYKNWGKVLKAGVGAMVYNLRIKKDNLITADSQPLLSSEKNAINHLETN